MKKTLFRIVIVVAFVALVAGAVALKQGWCANKPSNDSPSAVTAAPPATVRLPKLLDLGATKCIPCKMMAPILEQLKKDYAGRLEVEFIDVWEKPDAAKHYKIDLIPTQILYSDSGKELFRHVGFFSKEDILAKWKEFGVDLSPQPAPANPAKPSAASSPDKTKPD